MIPSDILNLVECFKKMPGVGEKSAERMAMHCLNLEDSTLNLFAQSLNNIKKNIKHCSICNSLTDKDTCFICNDDTREKNLLCVVEESKNIFQIEKLNFFKGKYHVLGGLISPLDDINPEDLKIIELVERIKKENIKEIIIVVRPSIEGETTALYLSKILGKTNVKISKIAHGIPLGAEIDYVDALTLEMALDSRIDITDSNN